jgi:hypothetical protein
MRELFATEITNGLKDDRDSIVYGGSRFVLIEKTWITLTDRNISSIDKNMELHRHSFRTKMGDKYFKCTVKIEKDNDGTFVARVKGEI